MANERERGRSAKAKDAFRTISEVADELGLAQHVLRFWESQFPQVKPMKRRGNRRYYRPADIDVLRAIQHLLHGEGYTVRGAQKLFREQGLKATLAMALGPGYDSTDTEPRDDDSPESAAVDLNEIMTENGGSKHLDSNADGNPQMSAGKPQSARIKNPSALKALLGDLKQLRDEMDS